MPKLLVRVMLVVASLCMVFGNWKGNPASLAASLLFLTANLISLVYNELRTHIRRRDHV